MFNDIDGFLDYVDHPEWLLFVGGTWDDKPAGISPVLWPELRAHRTLAEAREALQHSREKLAALRSILSSPPYMKDGARDFLSTAFIKRMAAIWTLLTSERPGKTGHSLFHDFCLEGWAMVGWPPLKDRSLAMRIERGEHLEPP